MTEQRFKWFLVDGEDFISDNVNHKNYDLCSYAGLDELVEDMNKLNEEKECWKDKATHKVLI